MKTLPLVVTAIVVVIFNVIVMSLYEFEGNSTKIIIISGVLSIIVFEITNYFYKKNKDNRR